MSSTRTIIRTPAIPQAQWQWAALLMAIGTVTSFWYTCTVPLVALGTIAALSLPRRRALTTVTVVWLANQVLGYTLHQYPQTPESFAWGAVLGVGVVASVLVTTAVHSHIRKGVPGLALLLLAGFVVYEGSIDDAPSPVLIGWAVPISW